MSDLSDFIRLEVPAIKRRAIRDYLASPAAEKALASALQIQQRTGTTWEEEARRVLAEWRKGLER